MTRECDKEIRELEQATQELIEALQRLTFSAEEAVKQIERWTVCADLNIDISRDLA